MAYGAPVLYNDSKYVCDFGDFSINNLYFRLFLKF